MALTINTPSPWDLAAAPIVGDLTDVDDKHPIDPADLRGEHDDEPPEDPGFARQMIVDHWHDGSAWPDDGVHIHCDIVGEEFARHPCATTLPMSEWRPDEGGWGMMTYVAPDVAMGLEIKYDVDVRDVHRMANLIEKLRKEHGQGARYVAFLGRQLRDVFGAKLGVTLALLSERYTPRIVHGEEVWSDAPVDKWTQGIEIDPFLRYFDGYVWVAG